MNQELNETFGGEPDTRPKVDRPLHPKGPSAIRLADIYPAPPGYGKEGGSYPRVTLVWLSAKKDDDGNPLWLFTTCPRSTYGGMKNGRPVGKASRLHGIIGALLGRDMEEGERIAWSDLIGKYVLGTVKHWIGTGGRQGAQVDTVMPLPEGMEVEIDLSGYVRPQKAGGRVEE